jgi:GNAT superfamily N-acetyltransferase
MYHNFIKNLELLCLGKEDTFQTKSTIGFTCDCPTTNFSNRVIVDRNFELTELSEIKKYHKYPWTLWIEAADIATKNKLSNDEFEFQISWPAMMLDLDRLPTASKDDHISIERITSEHKILSTWIPLVIKAYFSQITEEKFEKIRQDWHTFFGYLRGTKTYPNMHFLLGYWNRVPAATGLFIVKDDAVYVHWIGSLPDFRCKGLGMAITHRPLQEFKNQGIKKAFLFASEMGKPLYEKLGFTTFGQIDVYKSKQ